MAYNTLENIVIQKYDTYLRGKHYRITKKFDRNINLEKFTDDEKLSRYFDSITYRSQTYFPHLLMQEGKPDGVVVTNTSKIKKYDYAIKKTIDSIVKVLKSITNNSDDQARLAVSMVQNIPYDDKYVETKPGRYRPPYESYDVLIENKGVCGEKSVLLAQLLYGLGYATGTFYMEKENHRAAAIKVKGPGYRNTGYALIESTAPSIIGFNYFDEDGIRNSRVFLKLFDGKTFDNSEELRDVQRYNYSLKHCNNFDFINIPKKYQDAIPTEKNIIEGVYYKG